MFNYLTGYSRPTAYQHLVVAPVSLRSQLMEWIDHEALAGTEGRIILKANGLTDPVGDRPPLPCLGRPEYPST